MADDEDVLNLEDYAVSSTWRDIVEVVVLRLTEPITITSIITWIGFVLVFLLTPSQDRKEVALAVISNHTACGIIMLLLLFTIVTLAIVWYSTRRITSQELERVAKERDELQRKLGSPTESSTI